MKIFSQRDINKMYARMKGLSETVVSEKLSIFAGKDDDLIVILSPGTVIRKNRVQYEVEEVDVSDPKNPKVLVSRDDSLFFINKNQFKDFEVG
jgi:hypothetical protein